MIGKRISNVDVEPSYKTWWNYYLYKVTIKGNHLLHDAMMLRDFQVWLYDNTIGSTKWMWHNDINIYFDNPGDCKDFVANFKDSIINVQGVRTQKEYDVVESTDKILRRRLFFNKYRYIFTTFNPNTKLVSKMKKIIHNADARLSIDRDRWKHTIYLGSKKDVAKLQLTIGTKGYLKKVVLTDEL
jgi:hypothetical protein|tara:strand:+ start:6200 stop:6754 length:555 start_codon:yes stop_codon:yes gene_type:complete